MAVSRCAACLSSLLSWGRPWLATGIPLVLPEGQLVMSCEGVRVVGSQNPAGSRWADRGPGWRPGQPVQRRPACRQGWRGWWRCGGGLVPGPV